MGRPPAARSARPKPPIYAQMLAANAAELLGDIRPGDLVLLHDPQTAGLARALANAGAQVAWRCHIGVDWENDATRAAWSSCGRTWPPPTGTCSLAVSTCRHGSRRQGRDHTAVDRPLLPQKRAPRQRHGAGNPGPDRGPGRCHAGRPDVVHAQRRQPGLRDQVRGGHGRGPPRSPRSAGGSGVTVGPAQGHARGHAGLRRVCRARRRRVPAAGRPGGRRGDR